MTTKPARAVRTSSCSERSWSRRACHGWRSHPISRRRFKRGRKGSVRDHGSSSTASTTTKAAYIFSEIMIATTLGATFPVSSPEWYHPSPASHTPRMTHSVTSVMTHVVLRSHHVWCTVTVAGVAHRIAAWRRRDSGERATEACGTALEVRKAAGRTSPITRTRTVLARRERCQDLGGTIKDTARGRRHFNSFFVEGATIHAKTLSCLD